MRFSELSSIFGFWPAISIRSVAFGRPIVYYYFQYQRKAFRSAVVGGEGGIFHNLYAWGDAALPSNALALLAILRAFLGFPSRV